jgi:hypothetical protein
VVEELSAEHDQSRIKRERIRAVLDGLLDEDGHAEFRGQRAAFGEAVASAERAAPDTAVLRSLRRSWRSAFETLRVHFQNEEEIAFPLARDPIAAEDLATAGREMMAIEEVSSMVDTIRILQIEQIAAELLASEPLAREGRMARALLKGGTERRTGHDRVGGRKPVTLRAQGLRVRVLFDPRVTPGDTAPA